MTSLAMSTTLDLWREALTTMAAVAAPFLIAALITGLVVALIQTATQLQESVLAFVPKLIAALVVLAVAGNYALDRLSRFATTAITRGAAPADDDDRGRGPTP